MEENQALLVIDMQTGLLERNVYKKEALMDNVNALVDFFHEKNKPVFVVRHTNTSFSKENTEEWQVSDELKTSETDIYVNKSKSSVFKEKHFITQLKSQNISSVVIVGLVSNGCVQAACLDAKRLGLSVILIHDAHSTFHKDAKNVIRSWNKRLEEEGIQLLSTMDTINL